VRHRGGGELIRVEITKEDEKRTLAMDEAEARRRSRSKAYKGDLGSPQRGVIGGGGRSGMVRVIGGGTGETRPGGITGSNKEPEDHKGINN
jgi:hypothetical protein